MLEKTLQIVNSHDLMRESSAKQRRARACFKNNTFFLQVYGNQSMQMKDTGVAHRIADFIFRRCSVYRRNK